ncbi:MAG: hypothetical protein WD768_10190 [Phycisphaeraceae bacterium]
MPSTDSLFTQAQRDRVTAAVRDAESKTSAQIVPVIARASGRYDRAEDIAGLWLGIVFLIVAWFLYPLPQVEEDSWGGSPAVIQLMCMIIALIVGFFLGAILADKCRPLRRLFTPRRQMIDEVAARARMAFFDQTLHHTAGATGLLIFISLYEHRAAVLSDQAVLDKLGQPAVQSLCDELTAALKNGDTIEALCVTIALAGEKLGPVLPREAGDVNELDDALVVIDG